MLMNDKIIFDRCYCINSAETKEIGLQKRKKHGALYFTASSHFHPPKSFSFYARSGQTPVSHYYCAWRPVTSISESHVLTARARVNCNINAWLSLH